MLAKRRLLWRVRRKLILSYIFIGFVPALLIVAFFLLCGFLLFFNFSSYLVQSRLRALSEQARFLAQSTALEIQRAGGRDVAGDPGARGRRTPPRNIPDVSIARRAGQPQRAAARREFRDSELGIPTSTAGPVDACRSAAGAAGVDRLSGLHRRARLLAPRSAVERPPRTRTCSCAASRFPTRRAPATPSSSTCRSTTRSAQQLRKETGVELKSVTAVPPRTDVDARADRRPRRRRRRRAAGAPATPGLLSSLTSFLDYRDWDDRRVRAR